MEEDMLDDLQPAFAEEEGDEDVDVVVAAPRSSAAAAAPARAPLQRSSLDDVPHGMRDRGDAMCRLDEAGSASSGPAIARGHPPRYQNLRPSQHVRCSRQGVGPAPRELGLKCSSGERRLLRFSLPLQMSLPLLQLPAHRLVDSSMNARWPRRCRERS